MERTSRNKQIAIVIGILAIVAVVMFGALAGGDDIHPDVKREIDSLEVSGNCAGLQAAFDRYDDADVLEYIDDALRTAACYD